MTESRTDTGAVLQAPALRVTGLRAPMVRSSQSTALISRFAKVRSLASSGPSGAGKTSALSAIE